MSDRSELTLILIKPDALKLSLTGYLLSNFSEKHIGLRMAGAKIVHVSVMLARAHYAEHRDKPFFPALLDYITGQQHYPNRPDLRRVVAMVLSGPEAVSRCRAAAGPTDPHQAREIAPSTFRALGTVVEGPVRGGPYARVDNLVHTSSDPDAAEREIKLWFRPLDLTPATRTYPTAICREHFYLAGGKLTTGYTDGAVCLLAPGSMAWADDLARLSALRDGHDDPDDLFAVAAKYMINTEQH